LWRCLAVAYPGIILGPPFRKYCHVLSNYRQGWLDNWIYWTQLNYATLDYTLQFTVRHTHTNLLSPGVFSLVVTSQLSLLFRVQDLLQTLSQSPNCRLTVGFHSRPTTSLKTLQLQLAHKVKELYDRRPVGQCVLVSSPVWGS
jgi:hypothetical protein